MGDHADEAIDDMLFGRGMWDDDDGGHYADALSYRKPPGPYTRRTPYIPGKPHYVHDRYSSANRFKSLEERDDYFEAERQQPEFQQLIVTQLHGQTEKSYCVSGVVIFDIPYRGMDKFEFLADWIPKSQCIMTGNAARIPQWLVRSRWQKRKQRQRTIDIKIPF